MSRAVATTTQRAAAWVLLGGALAALVSAAPRAADAFTSVGGRWDYASLPIPYRMNLATAPTSIGMDGMRMAMEAGWATWSAPACTMWRTTNAGATALTRARPGDRENSVLFISGTWPSELGDSRTVIGVTTPLINMSTMRIFEADMQYNNVGFRWSLNGAAGTVDTQSIGTHEEGHFLGLGHTPISAAIMFASYSGGIKRTLNADDQSGVCTLYPVGGVSDAGVMPMGTTPLGGTCGTGFAPCEAGAGCACAGADCVCTRPCSGAMPCPGGFMCVRTSSTQSLCLMPGTGTTGTPCSNGLDCRNFLCLRDATGAAYCTDRCADDCACPAGFACAATTNGNVCQRGENTCVGVDAGTEEDSGMVLPGEDAAMATPDAGITARDGGMDSGTDGGSGAGRQAGCGCAVPAAPSRDARVIALGAAIAALVMARRRR